jgi:hypothetical protein
MNSPERFAGIPALNDFAGCAGSDFFKTAI